MWTKFGFANKATNLSDLIEEKKKIITIAASKKR